MKTHLIIISTVLTFCITACDRKSEEPKVSTAPTGVVQKVSEPVPATTVVEAPKKPVETEIVKEVRKTADVHAVEGVKNSASPKTKVPAVSTEQVLADTVDHAREVTKTQVSGSRQHSQKAEDEMSDSLKNK